jgi:2-hydroxychromene-2-carboxylate isomerase
MSRTVAYFFTLGSPWSYLGHDVFVALAGKHGARIDYKPVNLAPVFAETGGLPLAKRHPVRQRYRLVELQRWRDHRKLPLNLKPLHWPLRQLLADQVVIAILDSGADPSAYLSRAFRGIWAEDRDLAEEADIAACLAAAGLEPRTLIERARQPDIVARHEANARDAISADVLGAPSYVLGGEVFWGQDRLGLLAEALSSQRQPYRPEV